MSAAVVKVCARCGKTKPLTEYRRHRRAPDGHVRRCKTCQKADESKGRACQDCGKPMTRARGRGVRTSPDVCMPCRSQALCTSTSCTGCGKRMKPRTAQDGIRMCRPCRAARRAEMPGRQWRTLVTRNCAECGQEFSTRYRERLTCSHSCGTRRYMRLSGRALSEEERQVRKLQRWRERNVRRRGDDITSEPYTLKYIAERDGFRCGICGGRVQMKAKWPHRKSPTIDHIVPLSVSRDDTRANVQLAHWICNARKGDRGAGEQLLLIG